MPNQKLDDSSCLDICLGMKKHLASMLNLLASAIKKVFFGGSTQEEPLPIMMSDNKLGTDESFA